jgi:hypothetical protein
VASSTSASCEYTVQAGENSDDLTVSTVSGTIRDASVQAMTNFVPAVNLAANKNIVIDTVGPSTPVSSLAVGTYTSARSLTLSATGSDSIRYSLVSMPGDCTSGTLYSGAVTVSSSATIYARACKSSNAMSSVASFAYTISIASVSRGGGGGSVYSVPNPLPIAMSQNPTPAVKQIPVVPVPATISSVGLPKNFQFTKDLRPLMSTSDIKNLQIFLNNNGFVVSATGAGSKGKESNFMGLKTKAALMKFQEAYAKDILTPQGLKKGTGVLGPYSRKIINSWLRQ